jgi:hypothetical protein
MTKVPSFFDRLAGELGYADSGGLLRLDERGDSGAREMALLRVRRHINGITAVYFAGDVPLAYFSERDRIDSSEVALLHKKVWNDSRVPLLFVIDAAQVCVYDAWAEPTDDPGFVDDRTRLIAKLSAVDDLLASLEQFRRSNLDSGAYANPHSERFNVSKRCDSTLLRNLKITRERLIELGLPEDAVHNLLIRSILILHLEHRGILKSDFYEEFKVGGKRLVDLYPDRALTYEAFDRLAEKFNGDLLPVEPFESAVDQAHLSRLRDFLEGGVDIKTGQRMLWPLYDFSIIPIQLISSVYEQLLHATDPKAAKEKGAYYTPFPLAEMMLNEVLPWPAPGEAAPCTKTRIIDPSCGSGVFLVEAFRRLAARERARCESMDSEALAILIRECIFGIDENRLAVRIAAFSLCLALLDEVADRADNSDTLRFPNLTSTTDGRVSNLIAGDAFDTSTRFSQPFALVIGNPPWKRGKLPDSVKSWLDAKGYPAAGEIAQAFMWLARELAPTGQVAMLFPSRWLFNREGPDVQSRRMFFASNYVQTIINFSALVAGKNRLFNANAPAAGIVFDTVRPQHPSPTILHCAPRPGFGAAVPAALLIDGGDVKWIPRDEAERDAVVWKVMYAGSWRDLRFVHRLSSSDGTLNSFISSQSGWVSSRGFQPGGVIPAPEILSKPFVDASRIHRYTAPRTENPSPWPSDGFKRTGDLNVYLGPHILVKEGTVGGRLTAAFVADDCTFRDTITGIHAPGGGESYLKALVVYLNSSLATYYLFMTTGWGIDRKRVKKGEVLSLPGLPMNDPTVVAELSALFDEIADSSDLISDRRVETKVQELVFRVFKVTRNERALIKDMASTSIDYAHRNVRSKSIQPPSRRALEEYADGYLSVFGRMLETGGHGLTATIHDGYSPLKLVSFRFAESSEARGRVDYEVSGAITGILEKLDAKLLQGEGINLFRRRHMKVFEDQAVHIVKPAESRFWTRSAGLHDADETIAQTVAGMADGVS